MHSVKVLAIAKDGAPGEGTAATYKMTLEIQESPDLAPLVVEHAADVGTGAGPGASLVTVRASDGFWRLFDDEPQIAANVLDVLLQHARKDDVTFPTAISVS